MKGQEKSPQKSECKNSPKNNHILNTGKFTI